MLRVVEKRDGKEIVKSAHGGKVFGYGIRGAGATNQPFDHFEPTLSAIRAFAGFTYAGQDPAKLTKPKSAYPQFTGTSRTGKK